MLGLRRRWRWAEADYVLAGRDLVSGRTWLGVSERGRLAVVTNLHTTGAVDRPPRPAGCCSETF